MTPANTLQDAVQMSSPRSAASSRFRPYASPSHHVTKGRYITSNDPRGYIPVYEYPLNGQWIMMDIDDGYILWTGIWKALGNSKADIVKMIDSQPDLAPLIRRVRGGYLKIQGTWMPYEVALRLSRRVAYNIRDELVPLFGPTFPSTCLSPDQPGYGQIVTTSSNRRRTRRATQSNPVASSNDNNTSWTVVTPTLPCSSQPSYHTLGREAPRHGYQLPSPSLGLRPPPPRVSSNNVTNGSPRERKRSASVRYSPYMAPASYPGRRSPIDIPMLGRESKPHGPYSLAGSGLENNITLPQIQVPWDFDRSSSYALPPISAMEDLRGIHTHDSAAVLRRLKSDDRDSLAGANPREDSEFRTRRRSHSSQFSRSSMATDFRQHEYPTSRSPRHSYARSPSLSDGDDYHLPRSRLSLSVPSNLSADDNSTCDPSPISPTTPRSAMSVNHPGSALSAPPQIKDYRRPPETFHISVPPGDWDAPRRHLDSGPSVIRRHSDVDSETRPHRPW